jgi:hypothetical protein
MVVVVVAVVLQLQVLRVVLVQLRHILFHQVAVGLVVEHCQVLQADGVLELLAQVLMAEEAVAEEGLEIQILLVHHHQV